MTALHKQHKPNSYVKCSRQCGNMPFMGWLRGSRKCGSCMILPVATTSLHAPSLQHKSTLSGERYPPPERLASRKAGAFEKLGSTHVMQLQCSAAFQCSLLCADTMHTGILSCQLPYLNEAECPCCLCWLAPVQRHANMNTPIVLHTAFQSLPDQRPIVSAAAEGPLAGGLTPMYCSDFAKLDTHTKVSTILFQTLLQSSARASACHLQSRCTVHTQTCAQRRCPCTSDDHMMT